MGFRPAGRGARVCAELRNPLCDGEEVRRSPIGRIDALQGASGFEGLLGSPEPEEAVYEPALRTLSGLDVRQSLAGSRWTPECQS